MTHNLNTKKLLMEAIDPRIGLANNLHLAMGDTVAKDTKQR